MTLFRAIGISVLVPIVRVVRGITRTIARLT